MVFEIPWMRPAIALESQVKTVLRGLLINKAVIDSERLLSGNHYSHQPNKHPKTKQ